MNDLIAEFDGSPSPSADNADQYIASLRSVLDKHAPSAKRKVTERPSSPWFGLISAEFLAAKKTRRREEMEGHWANGFQRYLQESETQRHETGT